MNKEFWEGDEGVLRSGYNGDRRIPGFQFLFSWDNNQENGMHTFAEFLCTLIQDMAEQPTHRNSGRPVFWPL